MNAVARAQLTFQILTLLQKIDSMMVKQQNIIGLSIIGTPQTMETMDIYVQMI